MTKDAYKLIIMIFTVSLLITNVSARRGRNAPDWLDNPQSSYPESEYIVAIGSGVSRSAAEANAAGNISRIFQTVIQTEELFQERYQEIISGDSFSSETTSDINREILLSSSQTLFNLQYADSYTDNQGVVYVLAYIDRAVTTEIYLEMINSHIERVVFYLNRHKQSDEVLQKFAYIGAAAVISAANQVLIEQLRIIAPHHQVRLSYNHDEILELGREAARAIPFSVTVKNDRDQRIETLLSEMVTSRGFVVADTGPISIRGEVVIEDLELPRPEKFVRWQIILNVLDPSGSNVVSHSQRGREGHITQSEAVARAFRAMEREINNDFSKKLFKYFDTLIN